jgi:hypothetical protein
LTVKIITAFLTIATELLGKIGLPVSIDNRIENGSLVVNSSMTGPALLAVWKQRDKNQPKSPVKNQPPLMTGAPVCVRFKPDSKGRVFRPEQMPG